MSGGVSGGVQEAESLPLEFVLLINASSGSATTTDLAGGNTGYLSNSVTRVATTALMHMEPPVLSGSQVLLNFDIPFGLPNTFALQHLSALPGIWTDDPVAVLSTNIAGASFRFTTTNGGQNCFYRIRAQ